MQCLISHQGSGGELVGAKALRLAVVSQVNVIIFTVIMVIIVTSPPSLLIFRGMTMGMTAPPVACCHLMRVRCGIQIHELCVHTVDAGCRSSDRQDIHWRGHCCGQFSSTATSSHSCSQARLQAGEVDPDKLIDTVLMVALAVALVSQIRWIFR